MTAPRMNPRRDFLITVPDEVHPPKVCGWLETSLFLTIVLSSQLLLSLAYVFFFWHSLSAYSRIAAVVHIVIACSCLVLVVGKHHHHPRITTLLLMLLTFALIALLFGWALSLVLSGSSSLPFESTWANMLGPIILDVHVLILILGLLQYRSYVQTLWNAEIGAFDPSSITNLNMKSRLSSSVL